MQISRPVFRALPAIVAVAVITLQFVASPAPLKAEPGDTTTVKVFDQYLWTWNGHQDRRALFPSPEKQYERVLMRYTLTCPDPACGEWDYTTNVYIRDYTGVIDSSLQAAPGFTVDGKTLDSINVSLDTTWTYTYNTETSRVDTTANPPLVIRFFNDPVDAWLATDSLVAWKADYYNHIYDGEGNAVDSMLVEADSSIYLSTREVYVPFEVVDQYEIGRFITPYGSWFRKGWEYTWTFDVTDYAFLLRDSVEIRTFYDGWSQGSLYTLEFDFIEGTPARETFAADIIYSGGYRYGDPSNPIEERLRPVTVEVPDGAGNVTLRLLTTGHGFGGTDNAAEFSDKTHSVKVNGTRQFEQHLWRDDCGQNPVYPQAGTWYFSRAGWCPGADVVPDNYDLTPWATPGEELTIDYDMEPYVNQNPSKPASYIIQAQVLYAKAPNFSHDAAVLEVRAPNNGPAHVRMNPICSGVGPVVVIRNRGGDELTKLTFHYGIDGAVTETYNWTGSLGFMEETAVILPGIDLGEGDHTFTVSISEPNGTEDQYQRNNSMTVDYAAPERFSNTLYLTLKTDDVPDIPGNSNGIRYEVVNVDGQVLYARGDFDDNTILRDTFELPDGCYRFIIYDETIGDGLFPIYQGSTPGYFSLRDDKSRTVHYAHSSSNNQLASFGNREIVNFSVGEPSSVPQSDISREALQIFPNPGSGELTIRIPNSDRIAGRPVTIEVHDMLGRMVQTRTFDSIANGTLALDLSDQPSGNYMMLVNYGKTSYSHPVTLVDGK